MGLSKRVIEYAVGSVDAEGPTTFASKLDQNSMRVLDEIVAAFNIDRPEAFRLGLALMHIAARCSQEGRELAISKDGQVESVLVFPQSGDT